MSNEDLWIISSNNGIFLADSKFMDFHFVYNPEDAKKFRTKQSAQEAIDKVIDDSETGWSILRENIRSLKMKPIEFKHAMVCHIMNS